MYSFSWPNMFNSVNSNLLKDKDAIKSNLILLINCELQEMFGDPTFGTSLKKLLFEPATSFVADQLKDNLVDAIRTFIPQIYVPREAIVLKQLGTDIIAQLTITYKLDNTSDLYYINLTTNGMEE